MMRTKHTKGEWMVAENHIPGNSFNHSVLANGSTMVCEVIRHNFKEVGKSKFKDESTLHPCEESEANAKLIASAPEMLESLIKIDKFLFDQVPMEQAEYFDMLVELKNIIKKATE